MNELKIVQLMLDTQLDLRLIPNDQFNEVAAWALKNQDSAMGRLLLETSFLAKLNLKQDEILTKMLNKQKEVALIAAVILHNDLLQGSLYQVFDQAYRIAESIVALYLPADDRFWDTNDHEEWVVELVKNKYL